MEHGNTARKVLQHPSSPGGGTTNETVKNDLQASLIARMGVPAGLTYGDFKEALRQLGVSDDMPLASIEYGCSSYGNGRLTIDTANDGVEIREGR